MKIIKEKDFHKLACEVFDSDSHALSKNELMFCELYLYSQKKFSSKLFRAFPDMVDKIAEGVKYTREIEKEKSLEKEELAGFLEEYLEVFKKDERHSQAHKKEPCPKCELAKSLLRKLKK